MPSKEKQTTLILNGLFVYSDLPKNYDNKTSLEIINSKLKNIDFERVILLQNGKIKNIPDKIKNVIIENINPKKALEKIEKESKNTENIIIFNVGNPFFDTDFIKQMIKRHNDYIADYTYGLGYPDGLTPEIIRKDIIKEIADLIKDEKELKRNFIYNSISKDINSFDIETFLSENDMRVFRIRLGNDDFGEELLTKNLYNSIAEDYTVNNIVNYFYNNKDKLFTTIYLVILELVNFSNISSNYYPENDEKKNFMDKNLAIKIIESAIDSNDKINIILGGIGDPLLHENIIEIVKYINNKNINLIIETMGNDFNDDFIKNLSSMNKNHITFVVKLDSYNENTYLKVHPNGNFEKVKTNINKLKESGFKVYKQITRMIDNEVEIENYIRNKETDDLIIRKYSTFCKILEDKKVVDLSPIERIPCFHLRREIYVKSDGLVPTCMYSRFKKNIGNLNNESFSDIMKKLEKEYQKNSKNEYLEYCINCDDYYLFNF